MLPSRVSPCFFKKNCNMAAGLPGSSNRIRGQGKKLRAWWGCVTMPSPDSDNNVAHVGAYCHCTVYPFDTGRMLVCLWRYRYMQLGCCKKNNILDSNSLSKVPIQLSAFNRLTPRGDYSTFLAEIHSALMHCVPQPILSLGSRGHSTRSKHNDGRMRNSTETGVSGVKHEQVWENGRRERNVDNMKHQMDGKQRTRMYQKLFIA